MPLKLFLSHASVDKPFVTEVKRFLEDGADIECSPLRAFEKSATAPRKASIENVVSKHHHCAILLKAHAPVSDARRAETHSVVPRILT